MEWPITVSTQGTVTVVHQVLLRTHHQCTSLHRHRHRQCISPHRPPHRQWRLRRRRQRLSATSRLEALAGFSVVAAHEDRPIAWEAFSLVLLVCVKKATVPSVVSVSKRKAATRALQERAVCSNAPANVALLIASLESVSVNPALARWTASAHRHARRPQESVAISSGVKEVLSVRMVPVCVA